MKAGPHDLGVTFLEEPVVAAGDAAAAVQRALQHAPAPAARRRRCTRCRSPGRSTTEGPGDTPSRRRIFVAQPKSTGRGGGLREADPGRADAPGLPAAGRRRGPRSACCRSTARPGGGRTSTPASRRP